MSPTPQISKTIQTANGHITVVVQGNEDTLKIPYNTRFNKIDHNHRKMIVKIYLTAEKS
jgi:hypothetical protein